MTRRLTALGLGLFVALETSAALAQPTGGSSPAPAQASPAPAQASPAPAQRVPASAQGVPGQTTSGSPSSGSSSSGSSGTSAPIGTRAGNPQPPPPQPAVLPPVPNVAPGYTAPNVGLPNGEIVGVQQQPFVGINLNDAITMALGRNTDLAVAQANRRVAAYQIIAAQGAYDVRFQLVPSYTHNVQPPQSPFNAGPGGDKYTTDTRTIQGGFQGRTTNGGSYNLSASGSGTNTDLTSTGFNPYYPTALSFSFTQPLARGLAIDDTRRQVLLATVNASTNADQALVTGSQAIANVANTYWDLVAAWRNVAIQEEGLRNAQAQSASTARLARQGAAAPVDVTESNTQVDVFQDNIFSALQQVQRLQTQLKSLIVADPNDPIWTANLVPTSAVGEVPAEPAVNDVIVAALRNRPEIAQLVDERRTAQINLAYARDQLKPQIDLSASVTENGFAGQPADFRSNPIGALFVNQITAINALIANANRTLPPGQQIPLVTAPNFSTPAYLTGGLGKSWSNALSGRLPTYNVQLTIGLPLRNRTAKGLYDAAVEQDRAVQIQQVALVQRIKAEALNAIQALRAARYRLVAAARARSAAETVLASEQRRFAAGTSTTFLVLQRQLDLANERGRELQAQTDLNKAVVELQRVEGALFTQYGFDISTVGTQTLRAISTSPQPVPTGPVTTYPAPPAAPGSLTGR